MRCFNYRLFTYLLHWPRPPSLVIVCLSERFPLLICLIIPPHSHANSRLTRLHTHTKHNSVHFLSEVTSSAEASVFLVCFSGIITTSLFFSLQLLLSQNQKSRSCINGGIPSWIQTFCSWVFHYILPKNSHVPDALLLLSVFTSFFD